MSPPSSELLVLTIDQCFDFPPLKLGFVLGENHEEFIYDNTCSNTLVRMEKCDK